jgi:hypothetical protein
MGLAGKVGDTGGEAMIVPNAAQAVIADAKITDYLLKHPGKAAFFLRYGFTLTHWQMLRDALLLHVVTHEYVKDILLADGVKYAFEGALQLPDGRNPQVRSVWMIDGGRSYPRLITAYALNWERLRAIESVGYDLNKRKGTATMIREFEPVVFTVDLRQYGLLAGDVGTVADIHPSGRAYEVEVFHVDDSTYDVVTVQEGQIRPATKHEIAHARAITPAGTTAQS